MDDADRAQKQIERDLEASLSLIGDHALTYRLTCDTCHIELAQHRRKYGRCIECQEKRERQQRLWATGV